MGTGESKPVQQTQPVQEPKPVLRAPLAAPLAATPATPATPTHTQRAAGPGPAASTNLKIRQDDTTHGIVSSGSDEYGTASPSSHNVSEHVESHYGTALPTPQSHYGPVPVAASQPTDSEYGPPPGPGPGSICDQEFEDHYQSASPHVESEYGPMAPHSSHPVEDHYGSAKPPTATRPESEYGPMPPPQDADSHAQP
jgi:hypothetical protein